jgi:heme a synthase
VGKHVAGFGRITLAFTAAVALEGAFVRATGSGAGCGNHWPLCNGQVVFGTPAIATVIEFAHRSMTGIDTAMILGLLISALRVFPKRHAARFGAALSTVFLFTEALIGAVLVKFGLVVNDLSPARGAFLSLHLANTLALLACVTLTVAWARGHPKIRPGRMAWATLAATALLGITGALAALADTLYPAHSLAMGLAQDLNLDTHFAVKLRAVHPFLAVAVGLWLIYYAQLRATADRRLARGVVAMVAAQILAGIVNLLLLAPIWMQMVHLLLAYLLWIALVALCWRPQQRLTGKSLYRREREFPYCRNRWRWFRRSGGCQSAQAHAGERCTHRPHESPPLSAAALPGGDFGVDAGADRLSHPQHSAETKEHHRDPGGSNRCGSGGEVCCLQR